jgi:hypothetical protein
MSREYTNKALEMVDQGLIDAEYLLVCALKYMSEDDVRDMLEANELVTEEEEYA